MGFHRYRLMLLEERVPIVMLRMNILAAFLLMLAGPMSSAAGILIGVADSDGPPVAVIAGNRLVSGLSLDLGQRLAQEMGSKAVFVVISRKRVEWALENGKIDMVCNANPAWYGDAAELGWSREIYPQIERVATLAAAAPVRRIEDLAGLRIATIRGYSYPPVEPLWTDGKAQRLEENRLELMLKTVLNRLSDAAIVSELEYTAWARTHADAARRLHLQPLQITSTPTMCALSPRTRLTAAQVDQAIDRMRKNGALKEIMDRYRWQAR